MSSEADEPDLRGPLDLGPGDVVAYYQDEYRVQGVILLIEGGEQRYQYHLVDRARGRRILTVEQDRELVLTLQEAVPRPEVQYDGGDSLEWEGRVLQLTHRGRAAAWCLGDLPPEKVNELAYREFQDEEEEFLLTLEHWGQYLELRTGEQVHEGELTIRRQGEERFEIKAPVRLDLRTLSEARRAHQETEKRAEVESAQAELAKVREKLRRLKEKEEALSASAEEEEGEAENFLGL